MGRTYQALKRAEKKHRNNEPAADRRPDVANATEPGTVADPPMVLHVDIQPGATRGTDNESLACYEAMRTNMLARHPDNKFKVIFFSGTNHGVGVSTTAINFATTLAHHRRCKVLLVEANLRIPGIHTSFDIERDRGLSDMITNGGDPVSYIKEIRPGYLSVVTAGSRHGVPISLFESDRFDAFLQSMNEIFDYIILDVPPVPIFSEARVLCTKVDGVVLVLEAGKTRKQVAIRAKKEIEAAGGRILGVVLNKRKYYIPKWIYKLL
jgi:capsular exopolysaccharide synthesis family protein